ncbi:hypothetical protein MSG28_011212 [Choristoneura fumiferana]|uniref:Uncharacterized protein n=2 Tax=Choristoneura fumiferana TaxID=7141 RepID=A0ACC0KQQ8_CHOFU|nr:hypothetical protein MSG28_011212 [Choristoneura fumiferana]KAI8438874.1 hypothetical protein MSG28_011212 [Choristoneura fumiferana]
MNDSQDWTHAKTATILAERNFKVQLNPVTSVLVCKYKCGACATAELTTFIFSVNKMAADPLYGWDLTFKTVERDIRRKSDVLIAFIHWNLSKRGFRTIGIGDELTLTGDEEKSEVLPTGWNDKDNYTLRYVLEGKLYILHGLNTDGTLIVNLMRSDDLAVSNMAVKIEDAVKETSGSINKLMPTHTELMHNVKRDLIDTITEKPTSSAETQTLGRSDSNSRRPPDDPLRVPPRPHPSGPHPDTRDLGAVPPGARFDPFGPPMGPPIPGRRPPPDADHLPPPGGFNDNMFIHFTVNSNLYCEGRALLAIDVTVYPSVMKRSKIKMIFTFYSECKGNVVAILFINYEGLAESSKPKLEILSVATLMEFRLDSAEYCQAQHK